MTMRSEKFEFFKLHRCLILITINRTCSSKRHWPPATSGLHPTQCLSAKRVSFSHDISKLLYGEQNIVRPVPYLLQELFQLSPFKIDQIAVIIHVKSTSTRALAPK
jgi:hypothetical protein